MITVLATLEIAWEEENSKFGILKIIEYLEKEGLLDNVIKIEVVE